MVTNQPPKCELASVAPCLNEACVGLNNHLRTMHIVEINVISDFYILYLNA